jgi:hypothetical protein
MVGQTIKPFGYTKRGSFPYIFTPLLYLIPVSYVSERIQLSYTMSNAQWFFCLQLSHLILYSVFGSKQQAL